MLKILKLCTNVTPVNHSPVLITLPIPCQSLRACEHVVFCNDSNHCFSQENGTSIDDNSTPEPEDKNRLKVIKKIKLS